MWCPTGHLLRHPLSVFNTASPWDGLSPDIYTLAAQVHVKLAHWKTETLKEGEETILTRFLRQVTKSDEQGSFESHENIRTYEPLSC